MNGNQMSIAGLICAMVGTTMYQPNQPQKAKTELNLPVVCKSRIRPNSDIGKVCEQYRQINAIGKAYQQNPKKQRKVKN